MCKVSESVNVNEKQTGGKEMYILSKKERDKIIDKYVEPKNKVLRREELLNRNTEIRDEDTEKYFNLDKQKQSLYYKMFSQIYFVDELYNVLRETDKVIRNIKLGNINKTFVKRFDKLLKFEKRLIVYKNYDTLFECKIIRDKREEEETLISKFESRMESIRNLIVIYL